MLHNPVCIPFYKHRTEVESEIEQEFLHQVSVDTDVNIELLKDLYQNDQLWMMIRTEKIIDATKFVRSIQPGVELREAKMVVEAFAARANE